MYRHAKKLVLGVCLYLSPQQSLDHFKKQALPIHSVFAYMACGVVSFGVESKSNYGHSSFKREAAVAAWEPAVAVSS